MTAVLYLHGLESGPQGNKARWLRAHYGAATPQLDTSLAIAHRDACLARGEPWDHRHPDIDAALALPFHQAQAALSPDTQLIIGSSFGGAMLTRLIHAGMWSGPSLFIASAGPKLTGRADLPPGLPALLLHGRADDIVPLDHSRAVASLGGPSVMLWETGGGHRMSDILDSGLLRLGIQWLMGRDPEH